MPPFADFRRKLLASHGARALDAVVSLATCSCGAVSTVALGANANCGFPSLDAFRRTADAVAKSMAQQPAGSCSSCGRALDAVVVRYHAFHSGRARDLVASGDALCWWDPASDALTAATLTADEEQGFLHDAAFREVHAAFEMGQVERAVALVDKLIARFPRDAALIHFAGPLLARGYAKFAGELAAAHPDDADGLFWRGEVLFRSMMHGIEPKSRAAEALVSFERVLQLQPAHARAQLSRCLLLNATGKVDEAISGYEQMLAAAPDHAEARYNLGAILLDRDPNKALEHFVKGEQLRPTDADYHLGCARALIKLDRKMEAKWSLDRARKLAPQHPRLAELDAAIA